MTQPVIIAERETSRSKVEFKVRWQPDGPLVWEPKRRVQNTDFYKAYLERKRLGLDLVVEHD